MSSIDQFSESDNDADLEQPAQSSAALPLTKKKSNVPIIAAGALLVLIFGFVAYQKLKPRPASMYQVASAQPDTAAATAVPRPPVPDVAANMAPGVAAPASVDPGQAATTAAPVPASAPTVAVATPIAPAVVAAAPAPVAPAPVASVAAVTTAIVPATPAPVVAAAVAPVSVVPVAAEPPVGAPGDLRTLRHEMAELKNRIALLDEQIVAMESKRRKKTSRLAVAAPVISAAANKPVVAPDKVAHRPKSGRLVATKEAAERTSIKPVEVIVKADGKLAAVTPEYSLYAMRDSQAWLRGPRGDVVMVSAGDILPGGIRVKAIDPDAGVISTSAGDIR